MYDKKFKGSMLIIVNAIGTNMMFCVGLTSHVTMDYYMFLVLLLLCIYNGLSLSEKKKRFVLQGDADQQLKQLVIQFEIYRQKVDRLEADLNLMRQSVISTYVRRGRTSCSGRDTELVSKGYAGGSLDSDIGSAADFLCLPESPSWAEYQNQSLRYGSVYGSEYFFGEFNPFAVTTYDDVPCCLCKVPRTAIIMIPGRTSCYLGWTMEYTGYLMSGAAGDEGATNYVCVDENPEAAARGSANDLDHSMCLIDVHCGSLPCPPYVEGRQLACVVCSK